MVTETRLAPVVDKPATAEELALRLHQAAESGLMVVPVGGGRASGMGGAPRYSNVELHTTRLDRVLERIAKVGVVWQKRRRELPR